MRSRPARAAASPNAAAPAAACSRATHNRRPTKPEAPTSPSTASELDDLRSLYAAERSLMHDMRACQHRAISPAGRRIRQKVWGRTKAEVREKRQTLHRGLEAGLGVSATCTVVSCIRDWPGDGPTARQASTAGNYRRLAGHAIGKPGAVKRRDLTARQVQEALAELPASPPARSPRPAVPGTRLVRSPGYGERLRWQPVAARRGRGLGSRVCLARPQPCQPA
jgi:hypothetical protein